jgi:hypothetical protein
MAALIIFLFFNLGAFFIQLYRWFPSVLKAITIIRPETIVRWHRAGVPATGVGALGTWEAGRKSVRNCGL